MNRAVIAIFAVSLVACGSPSQVDAPKPAGAATTPTSTALPEEVHLADLRQLTLAGENAEAYWSFDGKQLTLQSRTGDNDCDRIYRMPLTGDGASGAAGAVPPLVPVSNGKGATTCSYFMPGDKQMIYASTQLGNGAGYSSVQTITMDGALVVPEDTDLRLICWSQNVGGPVGQPEVWAAAITTKTVDVATITQETH